MIEKQNIKDKDVWLKVSPWHVERDNPNIIPTEYFTVSYFFEAPVAAISYAGKKLQDIL